MPDLADLPDDDLLAAFGRQPAAVSATAPAPSVDYGALPDEDLISAFRGTPGAEKPTGADLIAEAKAKRSYVPTADEAKAMADDLAAIAARQEEAKPGILKRAGYGLVQGAGDALRTIVDPAASYLESKLGTAGVSRLLGLPTADEANAAHAQAAQDFERQYGSDIAANIGRAGGNIAATLPLLAAGGGVLGGVGQIAKAAAPAVAPVVDFLGGAAAGNKLMRYGSQAAAGAGQGAAGSALISAGSDQPVGEQIRNGAIAGAALGPALPIAKDAGRWAVSKLSGGGVNPLVAQLAQKAEAQGIPIRGGQISNSPFVKTTDSVLGRLPFTGYAAKNDEQRGAFTRAVSKTFGEDAPALTSDVMLAAKTRIGKIFDSVAARTTINAGTLSSDLGALATDASHVLPAGEMTPIMAQINNVISKISATGEISGDAYQALTRKGAPLDRAMSSTDPNVRFYAGQVRGAIDDALERSAAPDVLADLRKARLQYKNMKTIEDLAEKAGPAGQISPALLLNQVRKSYGDYAYRGAGDLGDLAKIGQQFLKEPPSSGTAERHSVLASLGALGAEGGLYWYDPHTAMLTAGGAALSALGTRAAAAALNSKFYRDRLIESGLRGSAPAPTGPILGNPLLRGAASYIPSVGAIGVNRLQNGAVPSPVLP